MNSTTGCLLGSECGLCSRRRLGQAGRLTGHELAIMFDEYRRCECGHYRPAHEGYLRGDDCQLCACLRWSPADGFARLRTVRA